MEKIIGLLIAFILGTASLLGWSGSEAETNKETELKSFSYSSGGNMNGNSYREIITAMDDQYALLSYSKADWYFQDPEVREYRIEIQVLKEIRDVYQKYHMDSWQGKTFSNVQICDGETQSYSFTFEKESVHFSSQVFDDPYYDKLKEIDDVIASCKKDAVLLPGLVSEQLTEEEMFEKYYPDNGIFAFEVCRYFQNSLFYRWLNGTDETKILADSCCLIRLDTDTVIARSDDLKRYSTEVSANSVYEDSILLPDRLEAGWYRLEAGELSCEFEIR